MSAVRVAVYARFSSDLQRETSIGDQIAVARRYADAHGWTVLDDHVYTDAAVSGASLERPGVQALLAAAAKKPLPWEVLLVDDSSRIARDLADAVRVMQQLRFLGVRVIYISQNIDSAQEQAETLVAVHGVVDSLYLREMSKKVKRGLAGQLERGYATGSSTYGYRTTAVIDPSGKKDPHGYPAVLGHRIEIDQPQAEAIRNIFGWFAAGAGVRTIVDRLNQASIPGPRAATWKFGVVRRILENERYTGKQIWGQVRFDRRPGSGQRVARKVPRDQWHVQDRPDLQIVSSEIWRAVQERHAAVRQTLRGNWMHGRTLMRGRNAALHSKYLFSGFMKCQSCGGSVTIMHGGNGQPRYGCARSWRNGKMACTNRLTVRATLLDGYLLAGLQRELLQPDAIRYVSDALTAALNARISDHPRLVAEATAALEQARTRLQRLVAAIESGVPAQTLVTAIGERERDVARLEGELAVLADTPRQPLAVIPSWVERQLQDLAGVLRESTARAKLEFRRLDVAVRLVPVREEGTRPFFRATVEAGLLALAGQSNVTGPVSARSLR